MMTSNDACRIHPSSSGFYEIHIFGQKEGSRKTVLDLEFPRQEQTYQKLKVKKQERLMMRLKLLFSNEKILTWHRGCTW